MGALLKEVCEGHVEKSVIRMIHDDRHDGGGGGGGGGW